MYVCKKLKVVYLATPRTGSRSVGQYLERVHNADPWGKRTRGQGHHARPEKMIAVLKARGYRVIATVRNHWDVLVSWNHHNSQGVGKECQGHFDLYVFRMATRGTAYHTGHSLFGQFTEHADVILRYENLEGDLAEALDMKVKLTTIGATKREPYPANNSPELAEFVRLWWQDEIERYGYTFGGNDVG